MQHRTMIWYKQDRGLFERSWTKDAGMVAIYVYLHCYAYLQDGILHGQLVRRGSCPTTRAAIMEATGLSESEVKLRLKKLKEVGEIIIKTSNKGVIITICDYDGYNKPEDLFEAYSVRQDHTPDSSQDHTPDSSPEAPYIDIKKEDNKIIRSNLVPSNNEREKDDEAYEIKKIYNKTFNGLLPEWKRLTKDMVIKIRTCIGLYGRQSVDMVFEQIKNEPFSLGEGKSKTGFIANHSFIFELKNYEAYLSRYELRRKKQKEKVGAQPQQEQKPSNGSWIDALRDDENWRPK